MPPRLTSAELEVLQILWEYGELKPAEIQDHFPRSIKNPALRSILAILGEKGHTVRRKEGKAFFYKAVTRRHSIFKSMLREVTDVFCEGSTKSLMMNLIKTQRLTEEQLIELKRMADTPAKPSKSESGKNS